MSRNAERLVWMAALAVVIGLAVTNPREFFAAGSSALHVGQKVYYTPPDEMLPTEWVIRRVNPADPQSHRPAGSYEIEREDDGEMRMVGRRDIRPAG